MRKYSRLKEAYYETEFIDDDDSKVGFGVGIPSDFPDWAPEGAYQAFINCYYNGDESQWNADVFSDVYEGDWGSLEDFVEHYFEEINTDEDWWDEDDENDEDADEGFDFGDEDSTIYEVTCSCGNVIDFDEETLEKGSIVCPNCGETLEFSTED